MKEEILFIKKQLENDLKPLSTDEVLLIFETTDDLSIIKNAVEMAEERLYVSWGSVETKDKAGELIPIDSLVQQQETLLKRGGSITDQHSNRVVGKTCAYKVLEHPKSGTLGVLNLNKIYDDNSLDTKVWGEIVSGERKGSSVGGINEGLPTIGRDEAGNPVKVLGSFQQMETATVFDPCNPLALNEAFSVVAKSNVVKGKDKLVQAVLNKLPSVIEEAYEEAYPEGKDEKASEKSKSHINKDGENNVIKTQQEKRGIPMETKTEENFDVKKELSDIAETIKGFKEEMGKISEKISVLEKQDAEEDEKEPEVEEKKKVAKQEASSDIEGESDGEQPEEPVGEDSNDKDVYKKVEERMKAMEENITKMVSSKLEMVNKASTPKIGGFKDVKKAEEFSQTPLEIATGQKKLSMIEVHKAFNAHEKNKEGVY